MFLNKISTNINSIKVSNENKITYSEFGTPFLLRNDMINILPNSFWKKERKVLEPCCGKGGFLIDIIKKFMRFLDIPIEKRYQYIVENLIFFGDINKENVKYCKKIIGKFNLNYFIGNALEKKLNDFDLVIGNPPYSSYGKKETGNTLYQKFIVKALNEWLNPNGFLLFVTPAAWRKPVSKNSKNKGMYELMTQQNWMKYLEIHGFKDAKKIFNAATRYDWYLIQKKIPKISIIIDENGKENKINLQKWPWIPNFDFKLIKKLLARKGEETVDVINSKYNSKGKHITEKKNNFFKYICIHSTPKKGLKYFYTDKKPEKIQKIIFGNSGIGNPIINKDGKYCLTEHAIGIIDDEKNLEELLQILKSEKMKQLLKACLWSNFQIDWKLFTYFKKDFYKMI